MYNSSRSRKQTLVGWLCSVSRPSVRPFACIERQKNTRKVRTEYLERNFRDDISVYVWRCKASQQQVKTILLLFAFAHAKKRCRVDRRWQVLSIFCCSVSVGRLVSLRCVASALVANERQRLYSTDVDDQATTLFSVFFCKNSRRASLGGTTLNIKWCRVFAFKVSKLHLVGFSLVLY